MILNISCQILSVLSNFKTMSTFSQVFFILFYFLQNLQLIWEWKWYLLLPPPHCSYQTGLAEKTQLLKLNVPATFMLVALDEGPGPPIKYQYAELGKLYTVVSQLVRCCDVSSRMQSSINGKGFALLLCFIWIAWGWFRVGRDGAQWWFSSLLRI